MAIRTINYTERIRIRAEDVRISLTSERSVPEFRAAIDFGLYGLPGDARVFVEAYRLSKYMRFDCGTVESFATPAPAPLDQFDIPDGVLFRVKVVSAEPEGLLLASADAIRPALGDRGPGLQHAGLLTVVPEDLGEQVWKLVFEPPILLVNRRLHDWRALVSRGPEFKSLVHPVILQAILRRILLGDGHFDPCDVDDWRAKWLRYACSIPGAEALPESDEDAQLEAWIDSTVAAFCRKQRSCAVCEGFWNAGGAN